MKSLKFKFTKIVMKSSSLTIEMMAMMMNLKLKSSILTKTWLKMKSSLSMKKRSNKLKRSWKLKKRVWVRLIKLSSPTSTWFNKSLEIKI